jgi:DNA-binding transcriptional MerR regulator/methylmalonyl-CoA mutase cobalamin-binding subunit
MSRTNTNKAEMDNDLLPAAPWMSIAGVERDTGLSKDTLRVWERRYGFPAPARDAGGERAYRPADVHKLRLLKRLLDAGHRPGRIVRLSTAELQTLAAPHDAAAARDAPVDGTPIDLDALLDVLRSHDVALLRNHLGWLLTRLGLGRFVVEVIAPLNQAVGEAWYHGRLEVFEEHLYTEVVQAMLRQLIAATPPPAAQAGPRVLLTTVPGEPHGLGLLMAEAMLVLEGCPCQSLGVQTPLPDIAGAAAAQRCDVVALSFSALMNPRAVVEALVELRARLEPSVQLWAGGAAPVLRRRAIDGVLSSTALDQLPQLVQALRRSGGPFAPGTAT